MRITKLKYMVAAALFISAVSTQAADVQWDGGDGVWSNAAEWVGGVVPVISNGTDNAVISSGTATYIPGPWDPVYGYDDLQFYGGSKMVVDGGTFLQEGTGWIWFQTGGSAFEISSGGTFQAAAGSVVLDGGGANTVDGATSSLELAGNTLEIKYASSLSFTAGATGSLSNLTAKLSGGELNVSDASTVVLKSLALSTDTNSLPSRINLSGAARLDVIGAASMSIATDSFINFAAGCTGYIYFKGINQATLEAMIAAGSFAINGTSDTTLANYKYVANGSAVNVGLVTPPAPPFFGAVVWTGADGDGEWRTAANWSGDAVPNVAGVDDVEISSATVHHVTDGGDLTFSGGSTMTLSGATFNQTEGSWIHFKGAAGLTMTAGSYLGGTTPGSGPGFLKVIQGTTVSLDSSTIHMRLGMIADDNVTFTLANNSTLTAPVNWTGANRTKVENNSTLSITDSVANFGPLYLGNYGGSTSTVELNDNGTLNLNASGLATATDILTKGGDSHVNMASDSALLFLDNISLSDVQTVISNGVLAIDGTIETNSANYVITANGTGYTISLAEPPPEEIGSIDIAYDGGDVLISWDSSAGQDYDIQSKSNLITQVDWLTLDSVVGSGSSMTVTTTVDQAESFYRVVTP